jgi:hypothetical protein
LQASRFLDDFHGRPFAEIGLPGSRIGLARSVEVQIGIGNGNLDLRVMCLDPVENGLRAEFRRVACRFVEDGIGNDDRDVRVKEVVEAFGGSERDERAGIEQVKRDARRVHAAGGKSSVRASAMRVSRPARLARGRGKSRLASSTRRSPKEMPPNAQRTSTAEIAACAYRSRSENFSASSMTPL